MEELLVTAGESDYFEVHGLYGGVGETQTEIWALFGRGQVRRMMDGQPTMSGRGDTPYNPV